VIFLKKAEKFFSVSVKKNFDHYIGWGVRGEGSNPCASKSKAQFLKNSAILELVLARSSIIQKSI